MAVEIPPEQQTYTVKQVAELCKGISGCSQFTLNAKCRDGKVKATKAANGSTWLIPAEEVRRLKGG